MNMHDEVDRMLRSRGRGCDCLPDAYGVLHHDCIYRGARTRAGANEVTVFSVPSYGLSRRETDVARLMVTGLEDKAIAATLVVALATVKWHMRGILGKTGAANRTQAAYRLGSSIGIGF
jgi:DNA-binding CsgD family transcriptional regulator